LHRYRRSIVSREAYVTVTVGFAPATNPGLVTGGTTAAADTGAPEGLFAALLAMLAPGQTPDAAAAAAADNITSSEFGALIQTLATSPAEEPAPDGMRADVDASDAPSEAASIGGKLEDLQKTQGKSLLKDLGDALIALNDSVEAGQPVDPALDKKLSEAIDALAIYLGAFTPPTTTITPRISALANGDGVIPAIADTAPPPVATTPPINGLADAPQLPPAAASEAPEAPGAFAQLVAGVTPDAAEAPDTAASNPAGAATTLAQASPALRQLGLYIGKLGEKLAGQDPDLAKKLDALAATLKSGAVPGELKAALGLDQAATERELRRIVEALATPKPATARPVEAKPFTAPTLALPQAVTAPKPQDDPGAAAASEPTAAPKLETSAPQISRPAAASTTAKAEKPEATDSKPSAAPAPAGQPQPDAAVAGTQATPPAAVAAARTIHAAYQAPLQQVHVPQVAFEVVRQFVAGNSRFQIRLDPPELGRIDVRLDVDKSGTVNARLTVERPETLDLMQRDQRALQQALQQAGLDGTKTNLEFSLRQNPFAQQGGMGEGRGDQSAFNSRGDSFAGGDDTAAEAATTTYRGSASASGLNLFV